MAIPNKEWLPISAIGYNLRYHLGISLGSPQSQNLELNFKHIDRFRFLAGIHRQPLFIFDIAYLASQYSWDYLQDSRVYQKNRIYTRTITAKGEDIICLNDEAINQKAKTAETDNPISAQTKYAGVLDHQLVNAMLEISAYQNLHKLDNLSLAKSLFQITDSVSNLYISTMYAFFLSLKTNGLVRMAKYWFKVSFLLSLPAMITKNITKLPKAVTEVSVTVPWADIAALWDQTIQKFVADAELPGFRKGQVPVEMVEQRMGSQIQQEFLKTAMPQSLMQALQGSDIVPIDYPQYSGIVFQKGQDLTFKAQVTERPKVTVGSYKTIHAKKPEPKTASDEEVAKVIDDLFKRWAARQSSAISLQSSATPTQNSASPVGSMNFNGSPPPAATNSRPLTADDSFAKAVGAQDINDLKAKIRADLEGEIKYNNELDYEEAILQEVEKMTTVDIPDILVQDELNRMLVSLQRNVADKGILMDDYLRSQNETMDSLKSKWREQALKNVRMELGLAEIARLEGVAISDQELFDEINKIQDNRLKQQFEAEEPRMHLRHALRQTKTLNLLKTLVQPS